MPGSSVVMATTPSKEIVTSFGRGLITYITDDMGRAEIQSDNIPQAIEDLVRVPLGQKLYFRPTWREVQPRSGRLDSLTTGSSLSSWPESTASVLAFVFRCALPTMSKKPCPISSSRRSRW